MSFSSALVVALVLGVAAPPLAAVNMAGFGGTAARAVASLTEPGSLLVWGSLLAGLAAALGRRRSK